MLREVPAQTEVLAISEEGLGHGNGIVLGCIWCLVGEEGEQACEGAFIEWA